MQALRYAARVAMAFAGAALALSCASGSPRPTPERSAVSWAQAVGTPLRTYPLVSTEAVNVTSGRPPQQQVLPVAGDRFVLLVSAGSTQVFDRTLGGVREALVGRPLPEQLGAHEAAFFDDATRRVHARDLRDGRTRCAYTVPEGRIAHALAVSDDGARCALLTEDRTGESPTVTLYEAHPRGAPQVTAPIGFADGQRDHSGWLHFPSPIFARTAPLVVRRITGCTVCRSMSRLAGYEQRFDAATLRPLGGPETTNLLTASPDPSWHRTEHQRDRRVPEAPPAPPLVELDAFRAPVTHALVSENERWLAVLTAGRVAVLALDGGAGADRVHATNAQANGGGRILRVLDDGSVTFDAGGPTLASNAAAPSFADAPSRPLPRLDRTLSCGTRVVHAGPQVLFVTRAGRTAATVTQWTDGAPVLTAGDSWWGPAEASAMLARHEPDGTRSTPEALRAARDEGRTRRALWSLVHGCER